MSNLPKQLRAAAQHLGNKEGIFLLLNGAADEIDNLEVICEAFKYALRLRGMGDYAIQNIALAAAKKESGPVALSEAGEKQAAADGILTEAGLAKLSRKGDAAVKRLSEALVISKKLEESSDD